MKTWGDKWKSLADGGSDQWLWYTQPKGSGLVFIFIEIIDLPAYMGSDATAQWSAQVSIVDLATASPDTIGSAIQSSGWEDMPTDLRTPEARLALAECLRSYGASAPMWSQDNGVPISERSFRSDTSKAFLSLRAAARREAESYLDEQTRESTLDSRIVNAIGQTAREYAAGTEGLWGALRRIKENPEGATEAQRICLRMYGACETTLGAGPIPADLRTDV